MKTALKYPLILLCCLLAASSGQAQKYQPMAADSTLWKVSVPADWSVYGHLTMGTAGLNGRSYYRLYAVQFLGSYSQFAFSQASGIMLVGLLREENKKVYYVRLQNGLPVDPLGGEELLYDFDVAEGDTVYTDLRYPNGSFGHEDYYIVTNLDTVNGVVSHEALVPSVDSLLSAQFPGQHDRERIIHGVGSTITPFGSILGTTMYADRSSSMSRGADMLTQYFAVGVEGLLLNEKNQHIVYPNPATERLFIDGLADLTFPLLLQVYDAQGREVRQEEWFGQEGQTGLDVALLAPGLFFVRLKDAAGRQEQLRFVKR